MDSRSENNTGSLNRMGFMTLSPLPPVFTVRPIHHGDRLRASERTPNGAELAKFLVPGARPRTLKCGENNICR